MTTKRFLGVATAVTVGIAGWLIMGVDQQQPEEPSARTPSVAETEPASASGETPAVIVETTDPGPRANDATQADEAFAPSLQGTEVDGRLNVDADGNLEVSREVRDYFDYFLATVGQRSLEEVVAHIEQQARKNLPDKAAGQAVDLLHDYVDYRKAEQDHMQQGLTAQQQKNHVDTLEQTFETLVDMRRRYLGQKNAKALFGTEEDYGRYALNRMEVTRNPDLTESERRERLARIEAEAPPEITEVRKRTTGHVAREQRVEAMREEGATDAEIKAFRAQHVGEEEAQRMAKIDAANERWQQQYQEYAKERATIGNAEGLSQEDREASIQRLRQRYFEGPGLARAEVRDRARRQDPDG
ncbi:lipase chaperone LimK [Halospina denitrificans]|uniref:Lipase chaperone n=1 Tax=Halospina denitrificans TaxID=332522 RepID=A0A4R7K267_9GAMM|nr:lipase secretion chaperone [Halospina denitrificans]TDT44474.1 lipase chaperone LimK [Halospina denitrificans]